MGLLIKHIAREPPSTIIDRLALMYEVWKVENHQLHGQEFLF